MKNKIWYLRIEYLKAISGKRTEDKDIGMGLFNVGITPFYL